jgi:hypothetical protein
VCVRERERVSERGSENGNMWLTVLMYYDFIVLTKAILVYSKLFSKTVTSGTKSL